MPLMATLDITGEQCYSNVVAEGLGARAHIINQT